MQQPKHIRIMEKLAYVSIGYILLFVAYTFFGHLITENNYITQISLLVPVCFILILVNSFIKKDYPAAVCLLAAVILSGIFVADRVDRLIQYRQNLELQTAGSIELQSIPQVIESKSF